MTTSTQQLYHRITNGDGKHQFEPVDYPILDWHLKPTGPGTWLTSDGDCIEISKGGLDGHEDELWFSDSWARIYTVDECFCQWFGPIPCPPVPPADRACE